MGGMMKVKLISSTHPLGEALVGVDVDLKIGMRLEFIFNPWKVEPESDEEGYIITNGEYYAFELRHGTYSTSQLKSIEYKEVSRDYFEITCKTRNSEYVFSKGKKSDEKPLSDDEILNTQLALGMHLI
jgi:hypothetical protein